LSGGWPVTASALAEDAQIMPIIDAIIRARMFAFLAGRDREFWPRDLVAAAHEGHWTIDQALAYLHELNTPQEERASAQPETVLPSPRPRRRAALWGGTAPAPDPSACYVPSINFAPVVDFRDLPQIPCCGWSFRGQVDTSVSQTL
jgi:hypothetical protein